MIKIAKQKVHASILKEWKARYSRGDIAAISRETGLSKPIVINAITNGRAADRTILIISKFYGKKERVDVVAKALAMMKK